MSARVRAPPNARERARRIAEALVPENPGRVVYGVVAVAALLAAESGRHESYADALGSAILAAALYWLAHGYAELIGRRLTAHERLTAVGLWHALRHEWSIVTGAAIPVLAVALAWAVGAALETAVTAALWCAVAAVVAFELAAGIRSHATRSELALELAVGVAMGTALIALKVLLHR